MLGSQKSANFVDHEERKKSGPMTQPEDPVEYKQFKSFTNDIGRIRQHEERPGVPGIPSKTFLQLRANDLSAMMMTSDIVDATKLCQRLVNDYDHDDAMVFWTNPFFVETKMTLFHLYQKSISICSGEGYSGVGLFPVCSRGCFLFEHVAHCWI